MIIKDKDWNALLGRVKNLEDAIEYLNKLTVEISRIKPDSFKELKENVKRLEESLNKKEEKVKNERIKTSL